jgi:hypothetical protein
MSDDIYSPPVAEPLPSAPIDRKRGRGVAIAGVVFQVIGLSSLYFTYNAILNIFEAVASQGERADPNGLQTELDGNSRLAVYAGCVGIAGGLVCLWSLFGKGNRERWFQALGMILALLYLIVFPFGTLIGIVLIIGFIVKWKEFRSATIGEVAHG